MDSSTTTAAAPQWPQDILVVKPMEEMISTCPKPTTTTTTDRKIRPQKEQALNCPRCNSTNTKFCYYNNYSLSQPRYFCKTCRRYWTEGGSLRNIPVGGGSRKNKRSMSSSSSSSSTTSINPTIPISRKLPDLVVPQLQNPNSETLENPRDDLNLGFSSMIHLPSFDPTKLELQNASTSTSSSNLDLLMNTSSSRGLNAFMPLMTDLNYSSSGFSFNVHPLGGGDQFKPSLNFSLDGLGSNFGSFQGVQEQSGKSLFPFEDLKQVNVNESGHEHGDGESRENNQNGDSAGYWPW